jgi:hypothetical protein
MPCQNWSRQLPHKILIAGVIKLSTLADLRELLGRYLPSEFKDKPTSRNVVDELKKATSGTDTKSFADASRKRTNCHSTASV